MSNADIRGRFIWHELMTTDPDAAGSFYSKVLPWKTQPSGMPSYTLWVSGKTQAGGLMALPAESQSAPPHWLLYIGTPNVDSTAQDIERLGGKILKSPADIPNVGRFAVATDPQGAAFAIYTPASAGDGAPPQGTVGGFSWHELATSDPDAATNFYVELFGWTKDSVHDMGPPVGGYQILGHAGKQVGGVFKSPDASVPPNWLSYVQVADAAKAANAAKAGGGRVLNGPMEVPGGSWVAQLMDPQGGAFAVVEAAKAAKPAADAKPAAAPKAKPAPAAKAAAPSPKPAAAAPSAKPAAAAASERAKPARKSAKKAAKKAAAKGARKAAKKAAGKSAARKAASKKAPKKKAAGQSGAAKRGAAKKAARKKAARKK